MKVKLKVVEKELESGSTLLPADRILCFPWHLAHKEWLCYSSYAKDSALSCFSIDGHAL